MSDPDLKREGIPQIKKDEENQEIKYSVRSILKNIPWVRKIFIVLPNKKVKYFKDYELIKDKIVYINDKDLLGFDCANSNTFFFNYWKLEKFNVSENIISMDDDYFIGKPLKKTDFFYVENGKVVPAIVAKQFNEETESYIINAKTHFKIKAKETDGKQNMNEFLYSIYNTYSFIYKLLKKNLTIPLFTHNAIPCNLKDIKELYNLVYNSEYKETSLDSIFRGIETLQFQTCYMTYIFNKYNRKVRPIPYSYIPLTNSMHTDYNISLFVLNTEGDEYDPITFKKARIAMEKAFPEPTPYEIIDYSNFPSLAFNVVNEIDDELNKTHKRYGKEIKKNEEDIKMYKEEIEKYKNIDISSKKNVSEFKNKIKSLENSKKISNIICFIETIVFAIIIVFIYKKNCSNNAKTNSELIKSEEIKEEKQEKKTNIELRDLN